jgi:hypothetical protein
MIESLAILTGVQLAFAAGLALLGSVTFDPSKAGSLRWPR